MSKDMVVKDLSDLEKDSLVDLLHPVDVIDAMADLFKMMADPTRLKIFTLLAQGPLSVENLRQVLGMSQSAVSHQLASLRKTNLVKVERIGKNAFYSLTDDHVMQIFKQALDHIQEVECN